MKQIAQQIGRELRGGFSLTADPRSFARFAADLFLLRLTRLVPLPGRNRERRIRVRGGIELNYRLNRGDMQSIREGWMDECYRLPFELAPGRLIDLGANIGLTSLWFAHRYGCSTVIAVEPSPENARIARLNLERNNIKAEVIEAAVGTQDGTAQFVDHEDSNRGHVGSGGRVVSVVSMDTLLRKLPRASMWTWSRWTSRGERVRCCRRTSGGLGVSSRSLRSSIRPSSTTRPPSE